MTDFLSLNLAEPLQKTLIELGYKTPTPIQTQAIPPVLTGKDLIGIAQTGTGKTAAFTLPLLNHLHINTKRPSKKGTRILILAPTRELITQITDQVRIYGRELSHLYVASVYGGVSILRHVKRLHNGNDVIVATPGRLIDLVERRAVKLDDVEMLVLDEADQMMDMGFIHPLRKIVKLLPDDRQTLLFSATMPPKIKQLAQEFLTNPVTVSVSAPNSTAENVKQYITHVNAKEKLDALALCLLSKGVSRAMVFTRTKHRADRVEKYLRQIGIDSRAIHGNKSQGQRHRSLEEFRAGEVNILVATDVAARGIDVPHVSHVFNFEIPNVPEQYVHRIGRTARANESGIAHALVSKDERGFLKDIQKLVKSEIVEIPLPQDFAKKIQELQSREPLPKFEPKPASKPQGGKGRGKKPYGKRGDEADAGANKLDDRKRKPYDRQDKSEFRKDKPRSRDDRPDGNNWQPERRADNTDGRKRKPDDRGDRTDSRDGKPSYPKRKPNAKSNGSDARPDKPRRDSRPGAKSDPRKPSRPPHKARNADGASSSRDGGKPRDGGDSNFKPKRPMNKRPFRSSQDGPRRGPNKSARPNK